MTFPVPATFELQLGATWVNISGLVYAREDVQITRGRADEASNVEASRLTLQLNNRDGRFSPRNPTGPYYPLLGRNTPIRVKIGSDIRFVGEVSSWPVSWNTSGSDVWVQVEAAGILRRLTQGATPLRSAAYRFYSAHPPQPSG